MANEKTKTKALKELGEKVTGKTLNNNATVVGMLNQIADNYSGGSGGGGILTINFNCPEEEQRAVYDQLNTVWETMNEGKPVFALFWTGANTGIITSSSSASSGGTITRYMLHILTGGQSEAYNEIIYTTELSENNTWDYYNG